MPTLHERESRRLAALREYDVLDMPASEALDRIVRLAAGCFGVPIAAVSLLDEARQWFMARVGLDVCETDRAHAFCAHTLEGPEVVIVTDASQDPRFCDNPLVVGAPFIRFYAGAPLRTGAGEALGALCLIDTRPRALDAAGQAQLQDLAALAMDQLELRLAVRRAAEAQVLRDSHRELERRVAERTGELGRANESLRVSQERLQAVLDHTTAVVYVKDRASRYLFLNGQFERLFAVTRESMLGRGDEVLFSPEMAAALQEHDAQVLTAGVPLEFEEAVLQGGEMHTYLSVKFPLRDGEGQIYGLCGISTDITARKRAEEALRASEGRLQRIAANVPGLVFEFVLREGGSTAFLFVSDGARELFGVAPAELQADASILLSAFDEEARAAFHATMAASAAGLSPWHWEWAYRDRAGKLRWLRGLARPRREGDGTVWDGFAFDVTAQKQVEDELRESRDEADRANRAKSEFLSRMSHELRTPLNAILGFGQLLGRAPLPGRQAESVAHILKAGRHLLELINEVLDLARIESGDVSISPEPVEMVEILAEALVPVRPRAAERGIVLATTVGSGWWVRADRQRLRQVLGNLLANAVQHNRDGGSVEVRCTPGAPGRLRLTVRDTGRGIAPELLPKLFVPFERLGAGGEAPGGTGIGMALSKRLLEAMGGHIEVQSEPGVGTVVTLDLAACAGVQRRVSPGDVPAPAEESGTPRRRVLYVEDNPANLQLMQWILEERHDLALLTATRGEDALRLAATWRPELVLLDLHLPGMSGERVLRRLREGASPAPVVIVSADAMPGNVHRLLEAGAADFLTKPLDMDQVLRVVDQHLQISAPPP